MSTVEKRPNKIKFEVPKLKNGFAVLSVGCVNMIITIINSVKMW